MEFSARIAVILMMTLVTSEDDKFVEKLTAMAMFDVEERRLEAERAEKDGFMFGGEFGDELDENEW